MNTDQGSQFTGSAWITTLTEAGVRTSMDRRGRYLDNIIIERLWLSLKHERSILISTPLHVRPIDFTQGRNSIIWHTMIISHRHKFIFLHSRKVAGSSITALLNKFIGPDDLQLGCWTESIKLGGRYNRKALETLAYRPEARSYLLSAMTKPLLSGRRPMLHFSINEALKRPYLKPLSRNPPHATAALLQNFAPEAWNDYYKFCFVRNPYEHAVSDYFWRNCPTKGVSFSEYLMRKQDRDRPDPERVVATPVTNWPIYTIDDEVAVDFVGRYETLEGDLKKAFSDIGLNPNSVKTPRAKSNTRKKGFVEMYDAETRALVEEVYKNELSEFGYGFPSA